MILKKLILLVVAVILITSFFMLPRNQAWSRTILSYWKDYQTQKRLPDRNMRMKERFGNDYIISRKIADWFAKKEKHNVLVLIPPTSYFTRMKVPYHVPEPAVFYYYTGLKTIWANSPDAASAGWYVRVANGNLVIDSVMDRNSFRDSIAAFQKMGVTL